jgi:hypothetical protein
MSDRWLDFGELVIGFVLVLIFCGGFGMFVAYCGTVKP